MTPQRLYKTLAIVGTLLLALLFALNNPVAGVVFFTCLLSSYVLATITGVGSSPDESDQKA